MHASPKKNQPKILFVSYEFQSLYFYNKESLKKKIKYVFNENTDQF